MSSIGSELDARWQGRPLCRRYLLAYFGALPLQRGADLAAPQFSLCWALGALDAGQFEVLGVWGPTSRCPETTVRRDFRMRSLRRHFRSYFWNFGAVWGTEPPPCGPILSPTQDGSSSLPDLRDGGVCTTANAGLAGQQVLARNAHCTPSHSR